MLSNKHILIRATRLDDYVHCLSKPWFYVTHNYWTYPMRTLMWDPMFDPKKETSIAIAWISFPSLPPDIFEKEVIFLLDVVDKPLHIVLTT